MLSVARLVSFLRCIPVQYNCQKSSNFQGLSHFSRIFGKNDKIPGFLQAGKTVTIFPGFPGAVGTLLRRLNNRTVKDAYSLPKIGSILDSLLGAKIFSTLDLKAGYWQVDMAEECKAYTAFTCGPLGFYECDTMPFGATNSPATFQRLMHDCLGDLNMRWCIVYLDDIIIFSDTKEEHLIRLEAVFSKTSCCWFET